MRKEKNGLWKDDKGRNGIEKRPSSGTLEEEEEEEELEEDKKKQNEKGRKRFGKESIEQKDDERIRQKKLDINKKYVKKNENCMKK